MFCANKWVSGFRERIAPWVAIFLNKARNLKKLCSPGAWITFHYSASQYNFPMARQGTSSQYQYCYLDLVIWYWYWYWHWYWYWYTICQLNQFNTNSEAVMLSTSSCHEWGPDISRSRSMRFWNASSLRTVMLLECWYIEQGSTLFYLPSAPSPPTFGFLASLWLLRSKYFPLPVPTRPSSYRFL